MGALSESFEERLREIEAYLDLLGTIEMLVRDGPPRVGETVISTQQQKILYSSVYLQLYNLVEATITWCLDAVASAAADSGRWSPGELTEQLRREWIRSMARTHTALNEENRLQTAIELCDRLIQALPIIAWRLDRRGGGNWDDKEIAAITKRLGCTLTLTRRL